MRQRLAGLLTALPQVLMVVLACSLAAAGCESVMLEEACAFRHV